MSLPPWTEDLQYGLPDDFDFSLIKTASDARRLMTVLPNDERGRAAAGLLAHRDVVGATVAYLGMMDAWEHDHPHVVDAFGGAAKFGACLFKVRPRAGLPKKKLRIWRGVTLKEEDKDHWSGAAFGVSWTRDRDIASWFALRFANEPDQHPFVFSVDIDPWAIIAVHHGRHEREVLVDVDSLINYDIVVDGTAMRAYDLSPAPQHLIERWRLWADRYHQRVQEREARWHERMGRRAKRKGPAFPEAPSEPTPD